MKGGMRLREAHAQEDVGGNLVPLIDLTFTLLLFFMLAADMGQRDLEDVALPVADQVKDDPNLREAGDRTTVNVFHRLPQDGGACLVYEGGRICRTDSHWLLAIRGQHFTTENVGIRLKVEADLEPDPESPKGKQLSLRKVMIRADRTAPFGFVQRVMEACGQVGIYRIEVGASKEAEES